MRQQNYTNYLGNGYLKFKNYKKIIEQYPFIKNVELSLSGEIFLNPELGDIIKFSYENDINLTAMNGVNFNTVSDDMLETLVKYKFKAISFSIDGASNETYSIYRRNGNYDNVIDNIKKLNEYKEKYKSKFPVFEWQYIAFKHNYDEIDRALETAKKLEMIAFYIKNPWNNEIQIKRQNFYIINPLFFDKEVNDVLAPHKIPLCKQISSQPQINWDGRILGCCCGTHTDTGINVFENGLRKAFKSKKISDMKKAITGKKEPNNKIDCFFCNFYYDMKKNNSFFNKL